MSTEPDKCDECGKVANLLQVWVGTDVKGGKVIEPLCATCVWRCVSSGIYLIP